MAVWLSGDRPRPTLADFDSYLQIQPGPKSRYDPFPLSDTQEARLAGNFATVKLGNAPCQTYSEVDVTDWDHERFEAALQKIIQRHEMLRCIILADGRQQILEDVPQYRVELVDLSGQVPAAVADRLSAVREQMCTQCLFTDRWPLFDIRVSRLASNHTRLHFSLSSMIADLWSRELLFRELAELYRNPDAKLPSLELSFRDYVFAVKSLEAAEPYRASRTYWLKRLPTLPPAPELPLAMNPVFLTRFDFRRRHFRIEPTVWRNLKQRAARLRLTPADVLLAAYAEVLTIWTKKPIFTIRLTLLDRLPLYKDINGVVGDFTAVNLLQVDNSGSDAFETRAKRLHERLCQDLDHRHFSGVRVMRELTQSQDVRSAAIMPIGFTYFSKPGDTDDGTLGPKGLGENTYGISQTPQLHLDCTVHQEDENLVINWDGMEGVFPPNLLDDMFESYCFLLGRLASDDSICHASPADNARRLIPTTQRQLVEEINATDAPISDELLHTLFLKHVKEQPNQTAVCTPKDRLTYADVYRWACGIEEVLLCRDIRPNQLVAIMMEKGWEQVVAVLGILFSGAAYLPIDPELPAERQRYLLERGEVTVVLTQSQVQPRLSVSPGIEILAIDLLKPRNADVHTPHRRQTPGDLAYVIFTSGSTGLPKGVMIDHRGAVNTVIDINQRFDIGFRDRVLALSRLSFDLSVYDIFGLLAAGGTIVLPSIERALDPAHWLKLIVSEGVTVWNTVPALMRLLVEEARLEQGILRSLRLVMMSGDWIPTSLPAEIRRLFSEAKIVSFGGATEASIWSILYPVEQVDPNWRSIPYGKPMLNQKFYVLAETLAPRPVWVPGQLYIGGIGVAKGYWRDEEKTAASFVKDPGTGQRLYRTGDLGRYLPDGNIEFLGREDFQVKVRGYRIELGEIEAVLAGHPEIKDSVVVVLEGKSGGQHMRAYIVPRANESIALSDVQAFLKQRLPSYMVPSEFVVLAALPLSPTGKVDRRALLSNSFVHGRTERSCAEPRSALERQVLEIWKELLEVRPIGVRDDFFELGGDSLLAVRLMYRIEQACRRKLPVDTLFERATIENLAKALLNVPHDRFTSPLVEVQRGDADPPFFFCHGDYSGGFYCRKLAQQLGKGLTFYALAPHGLDGETVPNTIEAMAADRVRRVLECRPGGPYLLGGYSNGGLVAFEMARQMRKLGLRVNLLAVVDISAMNLRFRGLRRLLSLLGFFLRRDRTLQVEWFLRLRAFFTALSQLSEKGRCAQAIFVLKKFKVIAKEILAGATSQSAIETSLSNDGPDSGRDPLACVRAMEGYVPGRYDGRMVLLRTASMRSESPSDPSAGWRKVAKQVEVALLPGDHKACVKEHVGILAEHLASCLRKATLPAGERVRLQ